MRKLEDKHIFNAIQQSLLRKCCKQQIWFCLRKEQLCIAASTANLLCGFGFLCPVELPTHRCSEQSSLAVLFKIFEKNSGSAMHTDNFCKTFLKPFLIKQSQAFLFSEGYFYVKFQLSILCSFPWLKVFRKGRSFPILWKKFISPLRKEHRLWWSFCTSTFMQVGSSFEQKFILSVYNIS